MSTLTRRTALTGLAAATVGLALAAPAAAAGQIVTVICEPHPDDVVLRLSGYMPHVVARGDKLILLACSDGGGSGVSRRRGWTPEYEREFRRAEQAAAWSALTGGRGLIVRLGMWDMAVSERGVRNAINDIVAAHTGSHVEVYAACSSKDNSGTADVDHRAVAAAVAACNAPIKRYSAEPGSYTRPNYTVPKHARDSVRIAAEMHSFGRASVPGLWTALERGGYGSRVVWS